MKNTMKKIMLLFAVVIVATLFTVSASAKEVVESGECGANGDNVTWVLYDDGELVISGKGKMKDYNGNNFDFAPWLNYNSLLKTLVIKNKVTNIGAWAFAGCQIENIALPENIEEMGEFAFYGAKITNIVISNKIETIPPFAFRGCDYLKNVVFGKNVKTIGFEAFWSAGLEEINIPDNVIEIDADAFQYCPASIINLPDNKDLYVNRGAFRYTNYYYDENNWIDGVLYIDKHLITGENATDLCIVKDGTLTIAEWAFMYNSSIIEVKIPDSVVSIGEGAFQECKNLEKVILSNNITEIKDNTFGWCSNVKDITIPNSVTAIGSNAFSCCFNLTELKIPETVTTFGHSVFVGCGFENIKLPNNLKGISFNMFRGCSSLKNITIPDNAEIIGGDAFLCCANMTDIIIPTSVTNIQDGAFYDCENLSDVYYKGTEEQWAEIAIGYDNEALLNATIHFNYTEPTPQPPESSEEPSDPTIDCECNCHAGGLKLIIFKIINFFKKLFGIDKTCACGVAHY